MVQLDKSCNKDVDMADSKNKADEFDMFDFSNIKETDPAWWYAYNWNPYKAGLEETLEKYPYFWLDSKGYLPFGYNLRGSDKYYKNKKGQLTDKEAKMFIRPTSKMEKYCENKGKDISELTNREIFILAFGDIKKKG